MNGGNMKPMILAVVAALLASSPTSKPAKLADPEFFVHSIPESVRPPKGGKWEPINADGVNKWWKENAAGKHMRIIGPIGAMRLIKSGPTCSVHWADFSALGLSFSNSQGAYCKLRESESDSIMKTKKGDLVAVDGAIKSMRIELKPRETAQLTIELDDAVFVPAK
jgi:hypothetical protein